MRFDTLAFRQGLDAIRAIPAQLGLRPYRVYALDIINIHSEASFGYGSNASAESELTVDGYSPKVQQLSQEEVLASGGLYQSQDLRVGPLTPGVTEPSDYDPALASGRTRKFRVEGPGLPANSFYTLIKQDLDSALSVFLVLRKL